MVIKVLKKIARFNHEDEDVKITIALSMFEFPVVDSALLSTAVYVTVFA